MSASLKVRAMAARRSRRNQEYQVISDEETDDEEFILYAEEFLAEEEEMREIGLYDPAGGRNIAAERSEGESEGEGGDGDEAVEVTEMGCSPSRGQECERKFSVIEEQFGACSDTTLPSCPICFVPWTADGPHRVCCLPCGHVYGRSCVERWIKQCKKTKAKCPQCSKVFKRNGLINLYASLIAVPNNDLEKEVLSLREKNESLTFERDFLREELNKSKKMACLEVASAGALKRSSRHLDEGFIFVTEPLFENRFMPKSNLNINGSNYHRCVLQNEIPVNGARVLGIDASNQILIVSGKKPGHGGEHILSKISLLGQNECVQIELPPFTGAVRDLCILPGSLALIASLGKKISALSMSSNKIVLKYDLPVPAWSCSGDVNEPYHIYAGLQNGILLLFDIRQTARCLESIEGLSKFPIHTICSLQQNFCSRKLLTASSVGPCLWDVGGFGERPFLIPELENQGICISLACGSSNSDIVASFRPKLELSDGAMPAQTPAPLSQPIHSAGKLGSHVNIRRIDGTHFQKGHVVSGYVSEVRMSKSAIVCSEGNNSLFASGDESTHSVCLWNLPSLQVHSNHRPHEYPILDLKYSGSTGTGFLGCISENKLQVFTCF